MNELITSDQLAEELGVKQEFNLYPCPDGHFQPP